MPIYSYKCSKDHKWEDFNLINDRHSSKCPRCGKSGKLQISAARTHGFKYGYFEHLGPDGTYVRNKKELKEALEKNDAYAPGVLD